MLTHGAVMTVSGVAIGSAAALALSRFIDSLLYGTGPTDSMTYLLVGVFLSAVGLLGSFVPARRATRVDPMAALRYE